MADITIFNTNFTLDVTADVSLDFSCGQGYSNGSKPWMARIFIDGVLNSTRSGRGGYSDVVSMMGAAGQLTAGSHNVQIIWWGDTSITLSGAVLRILITRR